MKRIRLLIYFFIVALSLFALARLYYFLTDDFRVSNIKYENMYHADWDFSKPSQHELTVLSSILHQPFTYLGKGAQSYAFVSEDQQYVIKFFKFKHLKPNWFVDLLPSIPPFVAYKEQTAARKKRKLEGVFTGYSLAYRENRQGSALVYLHLLPTHYLNQKVTVIDKMGLKSEINLDEVVFLIQRKGEPLRIRMSHLLQANQIEDAKLSLTKIVAMYISEYQKGMYDHDHGVMQNTGFVEDTPFHLDLGKFSKEESMKTVQGFAPDLEHVLWKIDFWVKQNYPSDYRALSNHLSQLYFQYTGKVFDPTKVDIERFKKRRKR